MDVVLLPALSGVEGKQSLRGKGPTYVFGDAGVEMQETTATMLEEALTGFRQARGGVLGGDSPEVTCGG